MSHFLHLFILLLVTNKSNVLPLVVIFTCNTRYFLSYCNYSLSNSVRSHVISTVMCSIVYCTGRTWSKAELASNVTDNLCKQKTLVYGVCGESFRTEECLNEHAVKHKSQNWYSCHECKKCFAAQKYLKQHMHIHSSRYKCSECGKCFRGKHALTMHRRSHSGEKRFECFVCGKRFTEAGNLSRHCRIHSGEKQFKCYLCDKAFSRSAHLNTHTRNHTEDKPHKCLLCDKSFTSSCNLQKHERRMHSNMKPHSCSYCGKLFKTVLDVKRHMFLFILMQSRSHVDAVLNSFCGVTNSRHIC